MEKYITRVYYAYMCGDGNGDGDRSRGNGAGMGTEVTGTVGNGDELLSPCHSLL